MQLFYATFTGIYRGLLTTSLHKSCFYLRVELLLQTAHDLVSAVASQWGYQLTKIEKEVVFTLFGLGPFLS